MNVLCKRTTSLFLIVHILKYTQCYFFISCEKNIFIIGWSAGVINSAVECYVDIVEVGGSSPPSPTIKHPPIIHATSKK